MTYGISLSLVMRQYGRPSSLTELRQAIGFQIGPNNNHNDSRVNNYALLHPWKSMFHILLPLQNESFSFHLPEGSLSLQRFTLRNID